MSSSCSDSDCCRKNSCTYFVQGGDGLLCQAYKKEQFYQLGNSPSSSNTMQAVYCKEATGKLSSLCEESNSFTCQPAAYFACPKLLKCHVQVTSSSSTSTECECPCVCEKPKRDVRPDICRLTEMVDVSSSVSGFVTEYKSNNVQTEKVETKTRQEQTVIDKIKTEQKILTNEPVIEVHNETEKDKLESKEDIEVKPEQKGEQEDESGKKHKEKRKKKCKCPVPRICKYDSEKSTEEDSAKEIQSSLVSDSDATTLICKPCKRKIRFHSSACNDQICPKKYPQKKPSEVLVEIKREKKRIPVHTCRVCKCKEKAKQSEANQEVQRKCKCHISPTIVICDKRPVKNKTFMDSLKSIISNQPKVYSEPTRCVCKNHATPFSISVCTTKGNLIYRQKLPSIEEHSFPQSSAKPNNKSRNGNKAYEAETEDISTKYSKRESIQSKNENKTVIKQTNRQKMGTNAVQNGLKTIYVSNSNSSSTRSVYMNPNQKIVQYLFMDIHKQFSSGVYKYGLHDVTYNLDLGYKSLLWLDSSHSNDLFKMEKYSSHSTMQTKWKPLEMPSRHTKTNESSDKFSQVTGIVEQYGNNDDNFLSIVKKFEKYKNQQRALEDMKRRLENVGDRKRFIENAAIKRSIRDRRKVYLKINNDQFCRIFCGVIAPLIYFVYFVIFIWVTF